MSTRRANQNVSYAEALEDESEVRVRRRERATRRREREEGIQKEIEAPAQTSEPRTEQGTLDVLRALRAG